jgi:Zn-dependent protease
VREEGAGQAILFRLRIPRLFRILTVNGVPIFAHWSTLLVAAFYVVVSLDQLAHAVTGIASYLLILVVHELGHQFMATRLGYRAVAIEIYPFRGLCRFDHPETKMAAAKIAWGGVIGQSLIAAPAIVRLVLYGYSGFGPLDTLLAICGPSNVAIAVFNLIPVRPLDGATAWSLFPQLWNARRSLRRKPEKSALEIFEEIAKRRRRP